MQSNKSVLCIDRMCLQVYVCVYAALQHLEAIMREVTKPGSAYQYGHRSAFLSMLTGWMQQGMETFSATQRIFEEVALRQNAATTKAVREANPDLEHSPTEILSDLASEGTSSFIEAQRILLSLAQQENEIMMNGVKERIVGLKQGMAMTDLVRRSLDTLIRIQQEFLKTTSKQTLHWLEAVKTGRGHESAHLDDLAREQLAAFVQAQKKFLDVIAQETAKATSGKHAATARTVKKTELLKLAREATSSFIDAQKRLLDVAGQQMKGNLKAATRTIELVSPSRLLPIAKLGEEVRNFVGAEKALIESMIKPRKGPKAVVVALRGSRHTAHPRKVERVRTTHALA